MNVPGRAVVVAFVGALLWVGCASDNSGGDDPVALCKQGCSKAQSLCNADSGGTFECHCTMSGGDAGAVTCTNQEAINAAFKACLEKTTCAELLQCEVPKCERGG